ncbi:Uncharacterised protein [Mycobacteroides abscessus subsp. abscessus]|nr:Uncharacterised protein [Mycobacteroides abscessus subsp. abscessus]
MDDTRLADFWAGARAASPVVCEQFRVVYSATGAAS